MNSDIEQAVKVLNSGGIIIFPTDTAFGIGCRIDNEKAIQKLFKLRNRPQNQATPVLVSSIDMASSYLLEIVREEQEQLMEKYWPGALTIVLQSKTEMVPELVRGYGTTIGVRMPNNHTILEIIKRVGVPILGPSANYHGEQTPYSFNEIDTKLVQSVDLAINGKSDLRNVSTVIDCTKKPWKILRQGAIKVNI